MVMFKNCTGKWAGWAGRCLAIPHLPVQTIVTPPGQQKWIQFHEICNALVQLPKDPRVLFLDVMPTEDLLWFEFLLMVSSSATDSNDGYS